MGKEVDADAEGPHGADALVHVDMHADLVQAERGHETADAGPGDHRPERLPWHGQPISWTSMRTLSRRRSPVDTASRSFIQA